MIQYRCKFLVCLLTLVASAALSFGQSSMAVSQHRALQRQALRSAEQTDLPDSVRAPLLGYVFDRARRGLRPIWGVPGASTLGDVVVLEGQLRNAQMSSKQQWALGIGPNGEAVVLDSLDEGPDKIQIHTIRGVHREVSQIVVSPTGKSAAMFYDGRRAVQLVRGLPQRATISAELSLVHLPQELTSMAISDDGHVLLLGTTEGATGTVFAITQQGQSRPVVFLGRASAATFVRGSHDALITDSERNQVLLVRDVARTAAAFPLAGEADGISNPVAVALSDDRRRAFVANSGSHSVAVFDFLMGGPPRIIRCDYVPSRLNRLGADLLFNLTELADTPLLLLDGRTEPRLLFVPAVFVRDHRARQLTRINSNLSNREGGTR